MGHPMGKSKVNRKQKFVKRIKNKKKMLEENIDEIERKDFAFKGEGVNNEKQ